MEKRNTLLVMSLVVFVFCTIYIGTDLLAPTIAEKVSDDLTDEEIIQNNDEFNNIPTTTVPTITITAQKESSPEEELVSYNDELNIGESDGAKVAISQLAIFVSEDERKSRTLIESVDLNTGCLDEEKKQDTENQWEVLDNENRYAENTLNISLKVESSVKINIDCVSDMILKILNDPRGWSTIANKKFQFTSFERSDFEIIFATPNTVDELCAPLATNGIYSCRRENKVVLNYFRWLAGAKDFGTDLATYRLYLVNHEVGHMLGWGHTTCPAEGALAPLMMQQSKSTNGCHPYGWPTYERLTDIYNTQK